MSSFLMNTLVVEISVKCIYNQEHAHWIFEEMDLLINKSNFGGINLCSL